MPHRVCFWIPPGTGDSQRIEESVAKIIDGEQFR